MPNSAKYFGTRGLVKVSGTVDGHPFGGPWWRWEMAGHQLPIKADVREAVTSHGATPSPFGSINDFNNLTKIAIP